MGTLLNIKPILYINEGKIDALDKVRSSKKAKQRILDEVAARMGQRKVRAAVAHVRASEEAALLAARAQERLNLVSLHISEMGPAIGSHVGPGLLGLAACPVGEDEL